jgi:hypothetical protein
LKSVLSIDAVLGQMSSKGLYFLFGSNPFCSLPSEKIFT